MNIIDSSVSGVGWGMSFIYNVKSSDTDAIIKILDNLGAGTRELENARRLLEENPYNSAITYSNKALKKSVMIFTDTTAQNEFVNSLVHEMMHLSRHIADCGNSEDLCNAIGNLAGTLFKHIYKS